MIKYIKQGDFILTSDGNVWREHEKKRILSKVSIGSHGYKQVWFNGKVRLIHRLIAENFISNHNNLPQVDHIDRNKTNNNIKNLEWVSEKENSMRDNNKKFYGTV